MKRSSRKGARNFAGAMGIWQLDWAAAGSAPPTSKINASPNLKRIIPLAFSNAQPKGVKHNSRKRARAPAQRCFFWTVQASPALTFAISRSAKRSKSAATINIRLKP